MVHIREMQGGELEINTAPQQWNYKHSVSHCVGN